MKIKNNELTTEYIVASGHDGMIIFVKTVIKYNQHISVRDAVKSYGCNFKNLKKKHLCGQ